MNTTTTTDHPGEEAQAVPAPSRRDLEEAWSRLHAANLASYAEGCCARAAREHGEDQNNPYHQDTDAGYWWREGYEGRLFAVLTDTEALVAFLKNEALRDTVPDDAERAAIIREPRARRIRKHPPASPEPTTGKQSSSGDALGVVHPTD